MLYTYNTYSYTRCPILGVCSLVLTGLQSLEGSVAGAMRSGDSTFKEVGPEMNSP